MTEAASRYLQVNDHPSFTAEFAQPAPEDGTAFVPLLGGNLDDILCERYERTVGKDNCVRFDGLRLQIPSDRHRCHYINANVRVHRYPEARWRFFMAPAACDL